MHPVTALLNTGPEDASAENTHFTSNTRSNSTHFLLGYGSLINLYSRRRSLASTADAPAVHVRGFRRRWGFRCARRAYTALAVERTLSSSEINGVLIPLLDPRDLPSLDARETDYARGLVPLDHIMMGDNQLADIYPNAIVWVYELPTILAANHSSSTSLSQSITVDSSSSASLDYQITAVEKPDYSQHNCTTSLEKDALLETHLPSTAFPIPQSYLDCVLIGCMHYGLDFARQFILSTDGWCPLSWLNDRDARLPQKYVLCTKAGESFCQEAATKVDRLLFETIPHFFKQRGKICKPGASTASLPQRP